MAKEFKIGEYAVGGIIKVDKGAKLVRIQALDWDDKDVLRSKTFPVDYTDAMDEFLNDLTTSYYADKIIDYIKN
jgi:hypothetical protein